jgi:hypothetical protein
VFALVAATSCDSRSDRIIIEQPQTVYRSSDTQGHRPKACHLLRDSVGRGRLEQYIISIARELRGRIAGPDQFQRIIDRWVETNFPCN